MVLSLPASDLSDGSWARLYAQTSSAMLSASANPSALVSATAAAADALGGMLSTEEERGLSLKEVVVLRDPPTVRAQPSP